MWVIDSGDHQVMFFFPTDFVFSGYSAEGANGLTTPEAKKVLIENKNSLLSLQQNGKCNLN